MYALVENNEVTRIQGLPRSWKNVSNMHALSDAELKELGWFPCEINTPQYDALTEYLSPAIKNIQSDKVVVSYDVLTRPEIELEEKRQQMLLNLAREAANCLFYTDWSQLEDAGLTNEEKQRFDALRTKMMSMDLEQIELNDCVTGLEKMKSASLDLALRKKEFTQSMEELEACLNQLAG